MEHHSNAHESIIAAPMRLIRSLRSLLACLILSMGIGTATAQTAVAADDLALSIIAWVYSIEASPDWTARMRGLSLDEETGTATIETLVVSAEIGNLDVIIEGATITGYAGSADGNFILDSLDIARGTVATPSNKIVLTDIGLSELEIPTLLGFSYDRSKPVTSLVPAYSALAKLVMSGGRVAEIAILESFEETNSLISYRDIEIGPLGGGKVDFVRAGPLKLLSPATDPLAELSVAHVDARTIDLAAFLHIYDPLRYVAGAGDGLWRQAVELATYSDLALIFPGVRLTFESVTTEGLRVRQPSESFTPLIDAAASERARTPLEMKLLRSRHIGNLLSAYGADRFAIHKIELAAGGIDQLTLDSLEFKNMSSDGFDEIALEGAVGAIAGQGAVAIGRLAVGDIALPPLEAIGAALDRAQSGADVDVSALTPKIGFLEAADLNLQAIDFPGAELGSMRADLDEHIGNMPTAITVEISDLDIATASIPNRRVGGLIASLGYERIDVDAGFRLNWRESDGTVSLDDFRLDIANFANTTAEIVLAGLTREAIEETDGDAFADLAFKQASLTFEDKSVVERSLSMRAELLNVPLDRLKNQLAGALPLMLAFVGNPEKVKEIVPVLQTFIKTPGTLTIEAAPQSPIPVGDIEKAIRTRPQSLPGLLAISIHGESDDGAKTPTGEAAPSASEPSDQPTSDGNAIELQDQSGTGNTPSATPAEQP